MRSFLLFPCVLLLWTASIHAADIPSSFLQSDDPTWKECLGHKTDFKETKLPAMQLIERLYGIPHIMSSLDKGIQGKLVTLPSTVVDQRTALWELQQQTGVVVLVSGMEPQIMRGTLQIAQPRK